MKTTRGGAGRSSLQQCANNPIYSMTFLLAMAWIVVSVVKAVLNRNGVSRYAFVQRNTVGFYLLIFISLSVSNYCFATLAYALPIFVALFVLHEVLWYHAWIQVTKDEGEVTENCYAWMNAYCAPITNRSESDSGASDLSESLFDGQWHLSNEDSYRIKFGTYFEYLKLEPGMRLLDIGCGNCQWLQYCKARGVDCTGITITPAQQAFCNANGIPKVIVGDIQKGVLRTLTHKFDAVSAIGPVEHFASVSQRPSQRQRALHKYYEEVKRVIDTNSRSARYLNSYMTTNEDYSKVNSLEWFGQFYLVASTFGYGFYNPDRHMTRLYSGGNSTLVIKRDYTEDYRWIMVREPRSIGYCNYHFDTPYRVARFVRDVVVDPSWWQRLLYGYCDSWFWQFGGTSRRPMPRNTDTPIRAYIYVTEIRA
jgi:SAM-dependent methyltransferase